MREDDVDNISEGQPVLASAAGTVLEVGSDFEPSNVDGDPVFGNYVFLDHGGGWKTFYLHLEFEPPLAVGQSVAQGEQIGRTCNSGADSMHLHYTQVEDGAAVRNRVQRHADLDDPWTTRRPTARGAATTPRS